jgi:hypothetical protein
MVRCLAKGFTIFGNSFEVDLVLVTELTAEFEPRCQIFALTDIEILKVLTTVCNRLDSNPSDTYTASD